MIRIPKTSKVCYNLGWKLSIMVYHVLCYNRIKYRCFNMLGCCVGRLGASMCWHDGLDWVCKLVGCVGLVQVDLVVVFCIVSCLFLCLCCCVFLLLPNFQWIKIYIKWPVSISVALNSSSLLLDLIQNQDVPHTKQYTLHTVVILNIPAWR